MEYLTHFVLPLAAILIALMIGSTAYMTFQQMKGFKATGTFFGPTVISDPLIGREKDLRFLNSRIRTGQSSAIIGPFSQERTALLNYLRYPENAKLLYENQAEKLIFSYLDVSSLKIDCTSAEFWKRALRPLQEKIAKSVDSPLSEVYQECRENHFDNYDLEKLVEQLSSEGWRLVLMLDQFEQLLPRPLCNPEFGGGLRSLAYVRTPSPLILIISGNMTIPDFHAIVRDQIGFGSPWFNFVEPGVVTLGALSDIEIDELLRRSVPPFADKEEARQFVRNEAGGHPYLVQVAAEALLESYRNQEASPETQAKGIFYDRVKDSLSQILQSWSSSSSTTCQACRAIVEGQDVSSFDTELRELEKQGFVKQDEKGQWQIRPQVFLEFLKENANQELCNRQQAHTN